MDNSNADLCRTMMDKYGLTREDAEHFLALMFSVIQDGLRTSRTVKVKSLGTFKWGMSNLRDADKDETDGTVGTEDNAKITFIPDIVLRERVNRPFEQFKTVVLNDGVDFSSLKTSSLLEHRENARQENTGDPMDAAQNNASVQPDNSADDSAEPKQDPKEDNQTNANADVHDMTSLNISSLHVSTMHIDHVTQGKASNTAEESEAGTATVAQTTDSVLKSEQHDEVSNLGSDFSGDDLSKLKDELFALSNANRKLKNECRHLGNRLKRSYRMLALVSALFFILVLGGVWGTIKCISTVEQQKTRIANQQKDYELLALRFSAVSAKLAQDEKSLSPDILAPTMENKDAKDKDVGKGTATGHQKDLSPQKDGQMERTVHQQPDRQKRIETTKPTEAGNSDNSLKTTAYDADPRIRTGAYRIVGIEKTVTLKKGQTLESVSRAFLGSGMECYVEAVNKRNVVVGDKINIPKLQHKKKR